MISITEGTHLATRGGLPRMHRTTAGIAIIEVVVAILVLGIGTGAAILGLSWANRTAERNRNWNSALALCQERIDGMVASPFSPPRVLPSCFGTTWPVPNSDTVISTEAVQVHADTAGTGIVSGTRTTLVSMANSALKLVRVTARVSYTYRGSNVVVETYTLRAPD